jgi:hypothetical protein
MMNWWRQGKFLFGAAIAAFVIITLLTKGSTRNVLSQSGVVHYLPYICGALALVSALVYLRNGK